MTSGREFVGRLDDPAALSDLVEERLEFRRAVLGESIEGFDTRADHRRKVRPLPTRVW